MLRRVGCVHVALGSRVLRLLSIDTMANAKRTHTTNTTNGENNQDVKTEAHTRSTKTPQEEKKQPEQQAGVSDGSIPLKSPLSSSSCKETKGTGSEADGVPKQTSDPSVTRDSSFSSSLSSAANNQTEKNAAATTPASLPPEVEPVRWIQRPYEDAAAEPIVDANGQYIVSRVQWPTGELAYTTPPPPDGKLAPRFGYNVVQVKKDFSWWKHYQKYPRISVAYINIQLLFLLGTAWLVAFLMEEHRRTTDEMRTPGALVGEQRGRGPSGRQTQKVRFTREEMSELVDRAQNNWLDANAEANYIGSKNYAMKKIPRPTEFAVDDFRKR
ncbi:uncharacterized protein TM35_000201280 [Trypanosoma theileri]|uniref:Uncharacterized protein n=1 Tax=Trypanosoma theileri TaxID=67003 RepID=A0A1X0NU57_9TRYP|nr:uncharacterized protein TM35_000201280 [Trypanosoma theileri]ORC87719.1 hypothetical protein TM35_000201280 [Trypanosoma theileri]